MLHNSCQWNTMTTCRYKPTCFAGTGVLCIFINWHRTQHYPFIEERPKQVWLLLLCFVDNGSDLYSVGSILVLIIVSHRGQNIYLNMFWEFLCLFVLDFAQLFWWLYKLVKKLLMQHPLFYQVNASQVIRPSLGLVFQSRKAYWRG